jgi:putative MATE family efflux protein
MESTPLDSGLRPQATPRSLALTVTTKQILRIAVPIMIGNFFHSIITMTDILFMTQVGKDELSAVGFSGLFYVVMAMIGVSFAQGAQILIARRAGENDRAAIGVITDNLIYISLTCSLVFFMVVRFGSLVILDVMLSSGNIYDLSMSFLSIRAWGIPFVFLLFGIGAFYTGIAQTMVFVWSASIMAVLNIVLNYALIFGHFGLPEMGIEGSALASTISEMVACSIMMGHALFRKYHRQFHFLTWRKQSWPVIRRILTVSGPIVLQSFTGTFSWLIFFAMIGHYLGDTAFAASNLMRVIYIFFSVPARGLGGAANTLVSNVMGQRRIRFVGPVARKVTMISIGITALILIPLILVPGDLLQLIGPPDAQGDDVIRAALPVIVIVGMALAGLSIGAVLFRTVMGTGAVRTALRMEVGAVIIYLLYAYVTMDILNCNLAVAWTAEIVYWLVLSLMGYGYLRQGNWIRLRL